MIILRYCTILALLLTPMAAHAQEGGGSHIQSAFLFAKKGQWGEAAAHAQAAGSKILVKYFTWEYLKDPQSGAGFDAIADFIARNPEWPDQQLLQKRAEVALLADNPSDEQLNEWFSKHPPQSEMAKLRATKDPNRLKTLIREAWQNDDYDKATEKKLLEKYRDVLTEQDHVRRIDRLLWEGRDDEARRLLPLVSYDYRRLFMARLSLMADKQRAMVDVVNVPPDLKTDPGLLYERLRWRAKRGDREGVRELLLASPAEVPYPEKWWVLRDRQIREAIGENNIPLARALLARHAQEPGTVQYKEAEWLDGWIELQFNNHPDKAYKIFTALYNEALTPPGKSRVAYWAARAAQKSGKSASHWFMQATHYPTTFYGQIAAWENNKNAHTSISSTAEPGREDRERFNRRELVQLVKALAAAHETDSAGKFIFYLAENAKTPTEAILAAHLGRDINRIDYSVRASKRILQNDIVSLENGFPVIATDSAQAVERPLLLALMRQESEFLANVVSSSGAVGLMQLLPRTAKEIARKSHMAFSADRLNNANYNIAIGSIYLNKLIEGFNGSYVLSVASYNAGPGRVREWCDEFGSPGNDVHSVLDWIEKIPTSETRNYVQHVLGNTEVYRFILAGKQTKLMIAEDLTR